MLRYGESALEALLQTNDEAALAVWHQAHLGRQGEVSKLKKSIGQCAAEQRKSMGQAINTLAQRLEAAFEAQRDKLNEATTAQRIAQEKIDVTLPPRAFRLGSLHPLTRMLYEVVDVFVSLDSACLIVRM